MSPKKYKLACNILYLRGNLIAGERKSMRCCSPCCAAGKSLPVLTYAFADDAVL